MRDEFPKYIYVWISCIYTYIEMHVDGAFIHLTINSVLLYSRMYKIKSKFNFRLTSVADLTNNWK